jgi:hypothetical protein
MIKERWILETYRLGRLGPHDPRGAIIEDDQHQRLLILAATAEGKVLLYRVGDMPVKIGPRLPAMLKCGQSRSCGHQRMDPAGELGCLAVCLLEMLKE